jgi:hypothetical protein
MQLSGTAVNKNFRKSDPKNLSVFKSYKINEGNAKKTGISKYFPIQFFRVARAGKFIKKANFLANLKNR